jgi:hypothetical protein
MAASELDGQHGQANDQDQALERVEVCFGREALEPSHEPVV